jgi:hypothetical protein
MNDAAAFSLALVLGSLTVTAQGFGQTLSRPKLNGPPAISTSCPVAMQAQHEIAGGDLVAINGDRPKGIGQQLHITLTNSKSAEIAGIKITVHGSAAKGSLLPTNVAEADSLGAKKTIRLKMTVGAKKDASTDLWVSGLTAVTLIDVDTVTYADGSNWRSSALESCHFGPDHVMLISSR